MSSDERPTGLKANKGIELLTWGTPNGWKASIILEELKEAYGKDYTFQGINISQNVQKEEWFTKLCPNGRIPVIVDHDQGGFAVMEGLCECSLKGLWTSLRHMKLTTHSSYPFIPHAPLRSRAQVQLHRPSRRLPRRTMDGVATWWPWPYAGTSQPLQPLC